MISSNKNNNNNSTSFRSNSSITNSNNSSDNNKILNRHSFGCFGSSSPINALFSIICKENGISTSSVENMSSAGRLQQSIKTSKDSNNGTNDGKNKRIKTPSTIQNHGLQTPTKDSKSEKENQNMRYVFLFTKFKYRLDNNFYEHFNSRITRSKTAAIRQNAAKHENSKDAPSSSILPDSRRSKSAVSSPVNLSPSSQVIRTTRTSRLRAAVSGNNFAQILLNETYF